MGRLFRSFFAVCSVILTFGLAGCGGGNSNAVITTSYPTPAIILLSPTPSVSLEIGKTESFIATPQDNQHNSLTTPVEFISSNTAVLTISSGGVACAGSWDSLTNPQVCTPGPTGTAQVTAVAQGVSSPATTVYVHQHIDSIQIAPVPDQTAPTGFDSITNQTCLTVGQSYNFQASALSRGTDITTTAGPFSWAITTPNVADVFADNPATPVTGLQLGQAKVTASTPGITTIYASAGNVVSPPLSFETCPVQSIAITVNGSNSSVFTVAQDTALAFQTTVTDIAGNTITKTALTWSSSNPATVSVTSSGDTATSSTAIGGGATIVASCSPPTCNIGFQPSRPVYPENAVTIAVQGASSPTGTSFDVSSAGCIGNSGCVSSIVPVTPSTTNGVVNYSVGSPTYLSTAPNSFIFDQQGTTGYLGTPMSQSNTMGLVALTPGTTGAGTTAQYTSAPGKILAISPDGSTLIVSDTADTPNAVYIFNTSTHTTTALQINGATAADFSPDSLKAYIAAGSNLYIYSKQDALQTINLSSPANDVSFLPVGAFAYVAGGASSPGLTAWATCNAYVPSSTPAQTTPLPSTPAFIRMLPDSSHILLLNSPTSTISILNVSTTPVGCPPTISNGSVSTFNFGQGTFVPTQFLVSSDGSRAFVLTSNLGAVLVFNTASHTSSSIAMVNSALPVRAVLDATGTLLYVIGSDGMVHVLDANIGLDKQQIAMPPNFCYDSAGNPAIFTCNANLIALKP
jgi:trimeric autotransporter adhesin